MSFWRCQAICQKLLKNMQLLKKQIGIYFEFVTWLFLNTYTIKKFKKKLDKCNFERQLHKTLLAKALCSTHSVVYLLQAYNGTGKNIGLKIRFRSLDRERDWDWQRAILDGLRPTQRPIKTGFYSVSILFISNFEV